MPGKRKRLIQNLRRLVLNKSIKVLIICEVIQLIAKWVKLSKGTNIKITHVPDNGTSMPFHRNI